MLRIQLDDRALFLVRWRDLLLGLLDADALRGQPARAALRQQVETWDPHAAAGAVGYRLVRDFHDALERRTFDALTVPARVTHPAVEFEVPRAFDGGHGELARQAARTCSIHALRTGATFLLDVVDESLTRIAGQCADATYVTCTWGEVNATNIRHPLSGAAPCSRAGSTCRANRWRVTATCRTCTRLSFGASERFGVSPGHEAQGYLPHAGRTERSSAVDVLPRRTPDLGARRGGALPAGCNGPPVTVRPAPNGSCRSARMRVTCAKIPAWPHPCGRHEDRL